MRALVAVTVVVMATASPAAAADDEIQVDPAIDGSVIVVGGLGWIVSEIFKAELVAPGCRWCADNGFDAGIRDALVWGDPQIPDFVSNITAFVLVPGAAFGLTAVLAGRDRRAGGWWKDGLVILEAAVIAADLNQIVKFAVRRERPFVHALPDGDKLLTENPPDNDLSFYSGHTTFAFALAVAGGTVASMRGYRHARAVWIAGLSAAAASGYLRIAADKHYTTDVVLGAALGGAIGFALPYGLHRGQRRGRPAVTATPTRGGAFVAAAWTW